MIILCLKYNLNSFDEIFTSKDHHIELYNNIKSISKFDNEIKNLLKLENTIKSLNYFIYILIYILFIF